MNRYEHGKIHNIVDVGYNKCYIGSTCEKICRRMERHKTSYNRFLKGKYNKIRSFEIFEEYGFENCKIELIELYPCNTKEELRKREGHYIENTDCINKYLAGRTKKEYHNTYKTYFNELNKHNYFNNRDKYLEMRKINHEQNKERDNQKSKDNYYKNKETIQETRRVRHSCDCGSYFTINHRARHFQSQKHQDWLKQQDTHE